MMPRGPAFGRYRLVRRIGVGGMAEVYEAELQASEGFTKRVALKLLLPHLQEDQAIVNSFIDEANIAVQLSHPNIVDVYDFGVVDGAHYLAMEHIDGWDLRELLRRNPQGIRPPAAAYILHELSLALDYIHTRVPPVIHRDVTPHNVFCTQDGHIKLGDFGVAKAAARLTFTAAGQIKGKLAYLAPEQASGDPVTPRTDVYAAGLILFELLTGQRLNSATNEVELIRNARRPEVRRPSTVNAAAAPLDELTLRLLEWHPSARMPSAALLAEALQRYLGNHPFDAMALHAWVGQLAQGSRAGAQDATTTANPTEALTRPFDRVVTATAPSTPPTRPTQPIEWEEPAPPSPLRRPVYLALAAAVLVLGGAVGFALLRRPPSGSRLERPGALDVAHAVRAADIERAALTPRRPGALDAAPATTAAAHDAALLAAALDGAAADVRAPSRPGRTHARRPMRRGAARLHPAPHPDAAVRAAPERPAAATRDAQLEQRRLRAALDKARGRGLLPGDDQIFDRLAAEARASISRAQNAAAALQRLERHVEAFRIDRAFAHRKLARLEAAIERARLGDEERRRISGDAQRILKLILAERLVEASQLISSVALRLRGTSAARGKGAQ